MNKQYKIKLISFTLTGIIALSGLSYGLYNKHKALENTLEYHYLKNIDELSQYVENIDISLTKAMYSSTPAMLEKLSSKIFSEASFAKSSLSTLPIEYLNLQNTYKLLSQVGDYLLSISKEFANGEKITPEKISNLKKLQQYCTQMKQEVNVVSDGVRNGNISLNKVEKNIASNTQKSQTVTNISDGFVNFEDGFSAYPTLIYDGPFSDHIMLKDPIMLKNQKELSQPLAKQKAAKILKLPLSNINDGDDENSKMASYDFNSNDCNISITKKAGLLSYMLRSRDVLEPKINVTTAIKNAQNFIDNLNIGTLTKTYYEISDNVVTINFAAIQDNVTIYTDLIKVAVALDNGEIMSFDARGYIVNHHKRDIPQNILNKTTLIKKLNPTLKLEQTKLCIIPTSGLNEVLCYEFKCKADNKDILVYINAKTGIEEQLLILLISDDGTLTL